MIASQTMTWLETIREAEQSLTNHFAEKMRVNGDLDRRLVSFQANKNENGHRWCKYKEGFSASLIRYILRKTGIRRGTVLDPFAGSGTTLFVAREKGLDSVGIELLPCSAEMIEARKITEVFNKAILASSVRNFRESRVWERLGDIATFPHLRITNGAFPSDNERALCRFLREVELISDTSVARVLRFAAMSVLEEISFTRKDGQYLRWDARSGRRNGLSGFNKGRIIPFSEAIDRKLGEIARDLECADPTLFDLEGKADVKGDVKLHRGSCLEVLPNLKRCSFNAVVTSPPYCNRYDYTRTYALELAMMGVGEDSLKGLRQSMLTCTVENREKDGIADFFREDLFEQAETAFSSQETLGRILSYLDACREAKSINNNGIPRMVRNYFREMSLVIFECTRVLKAGAPLVMVNDNVRYQGAHIPVDLILSDFAEKAGLNVEAIWVLPRGKGNSSQQMGLHGREEVRKCVYVWRKPKARRANRLDQ